MADMASINSIPPQRVGEAATTIATMTLAQKEQAVDELFRAQPTLLASAAVVTRLGVSGEVQDALVEIALIVFRCLRDELRRKPRISEADIERCCENNTRMWRFLDGEAAGSFQKSVAVTFKSYPEPSLLAYAIHRLVELKVEEPVVILAVKSALDACVEAKWGTMPLSPYAKAASFEDPR
jgi:hypothetical protein